MVEGTGSWLYSFGLFFVGVSVVVLVHGRFAERRRKRKWEKRCEDAKQAMIERERREKRCG